jgi:L-alanine-DL-glutamate epimerase-like enolase superfamily enzyme
MRACGPLLMTPPFPEYPSGHSGASAAAAEVGVGVGVAAAEADRVPGCPASGRRVVVPHAEAEESRVRVVEASREAEGLEAGAGEVVVGGHLVVPTKPGLGLAFDAAAIRRHRVG